VLKIFNDLEIENFIFTKLDETSDLSDMINFLMNDNRPLSYLSIGQEIPEDLMVASKEYILNKFMQE
jgi:flagellar biosynthesis protein FlhF